MSRQEAQQTSPENLERPGQAPHVDLGLLRPLLEKYPRRPDQVLPLLRAVQDLYGYLPREALDAVAEHLKVTRANVLGVATFYSHFSLVPQGRHKVCICRGTACHARGSKQLLDAICRELGIRPGETTPDGEFSVQTVTHVGACAFAPVMIVDETCYGKVDPQKAVNILRNYRQERRECPGS